MRRRAGIAALFRRGEGRFEGFETRDVETSETRIRLRIGGSGPPLLLLHGYPQSHAMWHRVAPVLAERFRVVCPDLRG
jgi:haloacetate dehalogenase